MAVNELENNKQVDDTTAWHLARSAQGAKAKARKCHKRQPK
jgi:hypothetical protein